MTLPPMPPLPAEQTPTHCSDGFKYGHSDATLQAYAEQYGRLCAEAKQAELDRLQARVAELEAALAAIAEGCSFPADDVQRAVRDRARAAIDTARKAKP